MKILMCEPLFYGIEYEINPWMNIQFKPDHEKALKQWEILYQTIKHCGAQIELVTPVKGWPDMPFTANAGLYYQNKIILSHFKYKERQGETPYFKEWFIKNNYAIVETSDLAFFEGAGDALPAKNLLFAAFGFRSERKFYETPGLFDQKKLIFCELVDPYFYHLDTCFCPVNDQFAIWYPHAFSEQSQQAMQRAIDLIAVSKDEAKRFACNAVVIDQQIIIPSGCQVISDTLKKKGYKVFACEMDEYIKAGGSCKCLTLKID